ncbi:hypothetical protein BH10ACT7_BH10ACT7_08870 [soil metagenome]
MYYLNVSKTEPKRRWWENLNRAVFPFMGPAQLGPFGEEPLPPTGPKACPLCGHAMDEHTFERSTDRHSTRMHCPV